MTKFTPELVIPQTREVSLETLVVKEKPFYIEEAIRRDRKNSQDQDGEEGGKKKDDHSSPKRKQTKEETKEELPAIPQVDKTIEISKKSREDVKDDVASIRSGKFPQNISRGEKKSQQDVIIEKYSSSPEGAVGEVGESKSHAVGAEPKMGSEITKDHFDSHKGEEMKDIDAEIDIEEQRRLEEEEVKRSKLYEKLLHIKPDIRNLKKWHVYHLGNFYELCLHPDPVFKKHCILTKNGRLKYESPLIKYKPYEDKVDKRVRISDFSKVQKLRVDDWSRHVRDEEHNNIQFTTLNSRFLDFYKLFTLTDLQTLCDLTNQLDGFVFYRVLPASFYDTKPYMNQVVHVMRRSDLISEMDSTLHGNITFSGIPLADQIASLSGLISDQEIFEMQRQEEERIERRADKVKRIQEQQNRRMARAIAAKEKAEAEAKAAEEMALKEKEASRSPAKAAALRMEKERMEKERGEAARQALDKDKMGLDVNPVIDNDDGQIEREGLGAEIPLMESGIAPIYSELPMAYENPYRKDFYQISRPGS